MSTPSAPRILTTTVLSGWSFKVAISGSVGVVYTTPTTTTDGLDVLNLANPISPVRTSTLTLGPIGLTKGVTLVNGLAYVAASTSGLTTYSVSAAGGTPLGGHADEFLPAAVAQAGHLAVIVGEHTPTSTARIEVVDVTTASDPVLVGQLTTTVAWNDLRPGIALNSTGTRAVVTLGATGVWVIDLSTPATPRLIGSYNTPGVAEGVVLNALASIAYVADGSGGLQILSLANPTPGFVGSLTGRTYRDVAVVGTLAYCVHQSAALDVVDVTTPSAPRILSTTGLSGWSFKVAVSGTFGIVYTTPTTTTDGLDILNLTNPTSPVLTSTLPLGPIGLTKGIALQNSQAFVAADTNGLQIYNVATPTAPPVSAPTVGAAEGVAVSGRTAYVADFPATLDVITW